MSWVSAWRRGPLALCVGLILAAGGPSAAAEPQRMAQAKAECADAKSHFDVAKEIGTRESLQVHIDNYGDCPFAPFARMLMDKLPGGTADAPAPRPAVAVPAVDAQARRVADGFVARLTEALQVTRPPAGSTISYESATTVGGDTKIVGLQYLTPRRLSREQTRLRFAETLLVKPSLTASGGFSAERIEASGFESTERITGEEDWAPFRNRDQFQLVMDSLRVDGPTILAASEKAPDALGKRVRLKSIALSGLMMKQNGLPFAGLESLKAGTERIENGLPYQFSANATGLSISRRMLETSGDAESRKVADALGFDDYVFGLDLVVDADSEKRTIRINRLSASMKGGGAASLIVRFSDIDLADGLKDLLAGGRPNGVLKTMNLDFATFAYFDTGLVPKLLDLAAAASGIDAKLLAGLAPAQAQAVALDFLLGDQATADQIRDATAEFMASPKSLTATMAPGEPINVWDLVSSRLGNDDVARRAVIALRLTAGVNQRPQIRIFRPLQLASLPPEAREAIDTCHQLAADSDDPQKLAPGIKSPADIDYTKALPACQAAQKADPTDPALAFELGRSYFAAGKPDLANSYYSLAAVGGHLIADYEYASAQLKGSGITADPAAAIKRFESLQDKLPIARAMLASIYVNGTGVPADPKKAVEIWQTGADKGEAESQYNIGVEYMLGTTIAADPVKGREYLQKAADQNHPDAMAELGKSFFRGDGGTTPDYVAAYKWAAKAAEAGSSIGQANAGFILASGVGGVAKDPAKAAELLLKALAQGDTDAEAYLITDKAKNFDKAVRKAVQTKMKQDGSYDGPATGLFGRQTMDALEAIRDTARS